MLFLNNKKEKYLRENKQIETIPFLYRKRVTISPNCDNT